MLKPEQKPTKQTTLFETMSNRQLAETDISDAESYLLNVYPLALNLRSYGFYPQVSAYAHYEITAEEVQYNVGFLEAVIEFKITPLRLPTTLDECRLYAIPYIYDNPSLMHLFRDFKPSDIEKALREIPVGRADMRSVAKLLQKMGIFVPGRAPLQVYYNKTRLAPLPWL